VWVKVTPEATPQPTEALGRADSSRSTGNGAQNTAEAEEGMQGEHPHAPQQRPGGRGKDGAFLLHSHNHSLALPRADKLTQTKKI